MSEVVGVMLVEEITGQQAHPIHGIPTPVAPGDYIECDALIYLNPNVMKALSERKRVFVQGRVIERRFIDRDGSWVCHFTVSRHAFHDARQPAAQDGGSGSQEG